MQKGPFKPAPFPTNDLLLKYEKEILKCHVADSNYKCQRI